MTGTPPVASAASEVFPHAGGRLASPRRDAVADATAPSEAAGLLDHCSDLKRQLSSSPVPGASRGSLTRRSEQAPAVRPLMNPSSSTSSTTSSCSVLFPAGVPSWRPSSRRILSSRKPIARCCSAGATWWRESSWPTSSWREAFENPGLAADSEHRQAVLGYLKADNISALPFRRLAGADTAWASQLFQHLLKKPSFS